MVKNSLVKQKQTFSNFLMGDAIKKKINETVGGENGQRFITSILSAVSTNPTLQECEHSSIISAAFLGEALKLSPSPQLGQYYMVPFNKKIKTETGEERTIKVAQFQLGYKGYIQLMKRSGLYIKINVLAIKEGELKKYDPLNEEIEVELIENDEIREQTPTIGYYAMFLERTGFKKILYWSKQKMLVHADTYSKAFNKKDYERLQEGKIPQKDMWKYSSFWYKDFDGMAYKTMLRQLISKWGSLSIDTQDMQEAYTKDMAEIKETGDYEYIESPNIEYLEENLENNIENKKIEEKQEKVINNTVETEKVVENDFEANDEDVINNFFN